MLFLFFSVACFGQENKKGTIKVKKVETSISDTASTIMFDSIGDAAPVLVSQPLAFVEQMPEFPGGNTAMVQFIRDNIKYPDAEKKALIQGTAYVTFVIEEDGSLSNIEILRGVLGGPGCDKEALRIVKMMPKWSPGKQNGRTVRIQYNLPIKFYIR